MALADDSSAADGDHTARVHDRRGLATQLHDDVVQLMSTALMAIGLARMDHPDDDLLREAEASLDRSAAALRKIVQQLGEDE